MKSKIIAFSGGTQLVTVGDKFNWNGMNNGIYEVVEISENNMYSPSGLGGTCSIMVKDIDGIIDEWCADSVANGIHYNKINH